MTKYVGIKDLNKKPSILIDLDDCLNNLSEVWIKLYNQKYNDNLIFNNITDWEIHNIVKPECGMKIYEMLKTEGMFSKLVEPIEEAIEATEILSRYFELYILTSCGDPQCIKEKYEFIETHYPHISTSDIITCKNKALITGNYVIDDYHENLKPMKCEKKFLINKPYNFLMELPNDIIRVTNWSDILWIIAMDYPELMEELTDKRIEKEMSNPNIIQYNFEELANTTDYISAIEKVKKIFLD